MKKVLVADDTKNIRNLLTTCLELNGYTVITANNGPEAIELITKEEFDIAFIDIKMPEMSGTEVLRRLRSMGYTFPVIIMTAYATVKNAVECTKLDAVAYLQKPFTVERVNDVLNAVQDSSLTENKVENLINHAKELIDTNNEGEAAKLLKKALSIDPSVSEIYFLLGRIYDTLKRPEEAEKYYRTAEIFSKVD